jgi:hypothetical protein
LVSRSFPSKKEQGLLKEMTDSGQGQRKHKLTLEHLVIPRSREVLKQNQTNNNWWGVFKGT